MQATLSPSVNYWPDNACARAFWSQQEVPSYQQLLADTRAWFDPRRGERWLDLGCGCGQLTQALWEKSAGTLAEIVALDCAVMNEIALEKLRRKVRPPLHRNRLQFIHSDFSAGLPMLESESFDGAVSGLAIQYAEHFCEERGCWTTDAYDTLLADIHRVLRVGGRLVFSVNVPEPSWGKIAIRSLPSMFRARQPGRYLKNALQMWRYGSWLKREARTGRFHYLPHEVVHDKLACAGFTDIEHRLSYAGQAFIFRCRKPSD